MPDNTDTIGKMLENAVEKEFTAKQTGPSKAIDGATAADTSRSTKYMREQMEKVLLGLERDMMEASEVRQTVNRRMADLTKSIFATRAMLDLLQK